MGGEKAKGERLLLGRVLAPFGIQGWVKVHSETRPIDAIGRYRTWQLELQEGWAEYGVRAVKFQGKGLVAKLAGVDDRTRAEALSGAGIAIDPSALPAPDEGEYYWRELVGMQVVTREGVELGEVDHLLETGANDVLVLKGERERLLPFIPQVVLEVDRAARRMIVDWDPAF